MPATAMPVVFLVPRVSSSLPPEGSAPGKARRLPQREVQAVSMDTPAISGLRLRDLKSAPLNRNHSFLQVHTMARHI